MPILELFFSCYRFKYIFIFFIVYKFCCLVFLCKALCSRIFQMLTQPSFNTITYSNIKNIVCKIGQYIDKILFHKDAETSSAWQNCNCFLLNLHHSFQTNSPLYKVRMSVIPHFIITSRSSPMPNANPEYMVGSMPHARRVFGCTIPAPSASIHPRYLHVWQPVPPQNRHRMSMPAPGYTCG